MRLYAIYSTPFMHKPQSALNDITLNFPDIPYHALDSLSLL